MRSCFVLKLAILIHPCPPAAPRALPGTGSDTFLFLVINFESDTTPSAQKQAGKYGTASEQQGYYTIFARFFQDGFFVFCMTDRRNSPPVFGKMIQKWCQNRDFSPAHSPKRASPNSRSALRLVTAASSSTERACRGAMTSAIWGISPEWLTLPRWGTGAM